MSSSHCLYSARTTSGVKLRLNDPSCVVTTTVGGLRLPVRSAAHLRRLERENGRVVLRRYDRESGATEEFTSHQLSDAAAPGSTAVERRLGRPAAEAYAAVAERGAARDVASALAEAVASAPDQRAAAEAVDLAARLMEGGANRNARHLRSVVQAGGAATLAHELSVLFRHPDDDRPAAGVTVRDVKSARVAAGIVHRAREAARSLRPIPASSNLSLLLARELVDRHRNAGKVAWVGPPYEEDDLHMSGFKLHIYCEGSDDVVSAIERLAPLLNEEQIACKFASSHFAGSDDPQARKGVTIYLPCRADAAEVSANVVAAMAGWRHSEPPGDDLALGNGVGLRFELGLDLGRDVDRTTYSYLYQPAVRPSAESGGVSSAAQDVAVAAVRKLVYDRAPDPGLLAEHLVRSGVPRDNFGRAARKAQHRFAAAVELADAGVEARDVPVSLYDSADRGAVKAFVAARTSRPGSAGDRPVIIPAVDRPHVGQVAASAGDRPVIIPSVDRPVRKPDGRG
jgi:hypothetical protein